MPRRRLCRNGLKLGASLGGLLSEWETFLVSTLFFLKIRVDTKPLQFAMRHVSLVEPRVGCSRNHRCRLVYVSKAFKSSGR